jgi:hypothetical protein
MDVSIRRAGGPHIMGAPFIRGTLRMSGIKVARLLRNAVTSKAGGPHLALPPIWVAGGPHHGCPIHTRHFADEWDKGREVVTKRGYIEGGWPTSGPTSNPGGGWPTSWVPHSYAALCG